MSDDAGDTTQATGASSEAEQQTTTPAEGEATTEPTEGSEQQVEEQPTKVEPEDDPRFAKQFAAIARREAQLTQKQQELKQQQQVIQRIQEFEAELKQNPLKALERYGLDLDHVIKSAYDQDRENDPMTAQERRLKAVEEEINAYKEGLRQQEETAKKQQERQRLEQFQEQIRQTIDSDTSDSFELIRVLGEYDLVFDACFQHFKQHNKPLPIAKAAAIVEDYLLQRERKAQQVKKLTAKQADRKQSQTLTNEMRNAPPGSSTEPETEEQRLERAAALIKWS